MGTLYLSQLAELAVSLKTGKIQLIGPVAGRRDKDHGSKINCMEVE